MYVQHPASNCPNNGLPVTLQASNYARIQKHTNVHVHVKVYTGVSMGVSGRLEKEVGVKIENGTEREGVKTEEQKRGSMERENRREWRERRMDTKTRRTNNE